MTETRRHNGIVSNLTILAPGVGARAVCSLLIIAVGCALAGVGIPDAAAGERPPDDFRISSMGPNGNTNYGAFWFLLFMMAPDVAYNPVTDQYLVVWFADHNAPPLVDNEFEIFGQLVNASTGALAGNRFRISFMGPNGNVDYAALFPAVTYNSTDNEFLVVWVGDHLDATLVNDHFEVFGRVVGANGQLLASQLRLSYMGPSNDPAYGVPWWFGPDVAFNAINNSYLVVWCADSNAPPHVNDEYEIWGRRFLSTMTPVDSVGYEISAMGPAGDTAYYAAQPAVAWDSDQNRFLIVWEGDHNGFGLADDEVEIFGQFVPANPATPFPSPSNFQISYMGGSNGNADFDAFDPDVAYNDLFNNYLVTWVGDDNQWTTTDEEFEVWGRLTAWDGTLLSTQYRLSGMGWFDGDTSFSAHSPAVISGIDSYHVVWHADDDTFGMVDGEFEVFSAGVPADPTVLGLLVHPRLTTMGSNGDMSRGAFDPALAYDHQRDGALLVWWGDDNNSPSVDDEFEIFGQLLGFSFVFGDGFETGNPSRWSSSVP